MPHFIDHQLILAGPTASGKSTLGLLLAQKWNGEIVNADAFQLYEGLDICTAKPSPADQALIPHHLYGILTRSETCDAARYVQLVRPVLEDIKSRGKLPILVGGSGLYIKALTHGLSDLPRDEALRENLASRSLDNKVEELLKLDPEAPSNVNLKNDRYVSRALEICLLTGQAQSKLRQEWENHHPPFTGILLEWERDDLAHRIEKRTELMFEQGVVQEIADSAENLSVTADKAIGVKEIRAYLRGETSLDQARELLTIATRQYAKRQRTWFRREKGFLRMPMHVEDSQEDLIVKATNLLEQASFS